MTRLRFRQFPALFALSLLVAGCDINVGEHGFSMDVASGKAQNEWTRTYTIASGGRLEVVNINGVINAVPGTGQTVEVRAERIAKARNDERAQEMLKQIEIVESASSDKVHIETKVPKASSWGRSGHEVRYWIKVPKGLVLDFATVNGGVRLENLDNEIVATTTNGGVRGKGLRGVVKADTTNGGVEIEMAAVTGSVNLGTTNGGIRLRLPRDAKANLEARVVNGGIGVDEGWTSLQATEKSRRYFRGTLNGGGPNIAVETTNGGVTIAPLAGSTTETP